VAYNCPIHKFTLTWTFYICPISQSELHRITLFVTRSNQPSNWGPQLPSNVPLRRICFSTLTSLFVPLFAALFSFATNSITVPFGIGERKRRNSGCRTAYFNGNDLICPIKESNRHNANVRERRWRQIGKCRIGQAIVTRQDDEDDCFLTLEMVANWDLVSDIKRKMLPIKNE